MISLLCAALQIHRLPDTDEFVLNVIAGRVDATSARNVLTIGGDSLLRHWNGRTQRVVPCASPPRQVAFLTPSVAAVQTRKDVRIIDCRNGRILGSFRSARLIKARATSRCYLRSKSKLSGIEMHAGRIALREIFFRPGAASEIFDIEASSKRVLFQDIESGRVKLASRFGGLTDLGEGRRASFDGERVLLVTEAGEVDRVDPTRKSPPVKIDFPLPIVESVVPLSQGGYLATGEDLVSLVTAQGQRFRTESLGTDIFDFALTKNGDALIATRGGLVTSIKTLLPPTRRRHSESMRAQE